MGRRKPSPPTPEEIAGHVDRWIDEAKSLPPRTASRLLLAKAAFVETMARQAAADAFALAVALGRLTAEAHSLSAT